MTEGATVAGRVAGPFTRAWAGLPRHAGALLARLAGWAACWLVIEFLVIVSGTAPGQPVWVVLHVTYFVGTSYFEADLLGRALEAAGGAPRPQTRIAAAWVVTLRFFTLKMLLLPLFLAGLALLVVPGLYVAARFGPAFLVVAEGGAGVRQALARSAELGRGEGVALVRFAGALVLLNLLGLALAGVGLVVTLPWSALAIAHRYRALVAGESALPRAR